MQIFRTPTVRRAAVALTVAAVAAGGVAVSSAADATPTRHTAAKHIQHFIIGGSENKQVAILHGPITAGAKDISHDTYDVLKFSNGTLRVNHPEKDSKFTPKVNSKTCYATFTLTGKYTLARGTGAYRGVTGRGTYRGTGEAILPRTKSGSCSMSADPTFEIFTLTGSGPISR